MKLTLCIVLVVCTLSAMSAVPRLTRAINPEENQHDTVSPTWCATQTPCGWTFYSPETATITTNIMNTYCKCGPGTKCAVFEDDKTVSAYILRCLPS